MASTSAREPNGYRTNTPERSGKPREIAMTTRTSSKIAKSSMIAVVLGTIVAGAVMSTIAYAEDANCPAWSTPRCSQWGGTLTNPVCTHWDCVADKSSDPPKRAVSIPTNPNPINPPPRAIVGIPPVKVGGFTPIPPNRLKPPIVATGGINPGVGGNTTIYALRGGGGGHGRH